MVDSFLLVYPLLLPSQSPYKNLTHEWVVVGIDFSRTIHVCVMFTITINITHKIFIEVLFTIYISKDMGAI